MGFRLHSDITPKQAYLVYKFTRHPNAVLDLIVKLLYLLFPIHVFLRYKPISSLAFSASSTYDETLQQNLNCLKKAKSWVKYNYKIGPRKNITKSYYV